MILVDSTPEHIEVSLVHNAFKVSYAVEPLEVATSLAEGFSVEYPEIQEIPVELLTKDSPCENNS